MYHNNSTYLIERWPLGWLVCSPQGKAGVPMDALQECMPLFDANSVIDSGIARHYTVTRGIKAVFCIATPENANFWRREIEAYLSPFDRERRWWLGVDVGTSSASIFAVFCERNMLKNEAKEYGGGSIPKDSDDFGRCSRLLKLFPEWKPRLKEVAEAYPSTRWGELVSRWDELENATPLNCSVILSPNSI